MRYVDSTIMFIFSMTLLLMLFMDASLTDSIARETQLVFNNNKEEAYKALQYAIVTSAILVIGTIFIIATFCAKYQKNEGDSSEFPAHYLFRFFNFIIGAVIIGTVLYFYEGLELADNILLFQEAFVVFLMVINIGILFSQFNVMFFLAAIIANGGYLVWHHDAESMYFILMNLGASVVVCLVMFAYLRNIGINLDEVSGNKNWRELELRIRAAEKEGIKTVTIQAGVVKKTVDRQYNAGDNLHPTI